MTTSRNRCGTRRAAAALGLLLALAACGDATAESPKAAGPAADAGRGTPTTTQAPSPATGPSVDFADGPLDAAREDFGAGPYRYSLALTGLSPQRSGPGVNDSMSGESGEKTVFIGFSGLLRNLDMAGEAPIPQLFEGPGDDKARLEFAVPKDRRTVPSSDYSDKVFACRTSGHAAGSCAKRGVMCYVVGADVGDDEGRSGPFHGQRQVRATDRLSPGATVPISCYSSHGGGNQFESHGRDEVSDQITAQEITAYLCRNANNTCVKLRAP